MISNVAQEQAIFEFQCPVCGTSSDAMSGHNSNVREVPIAGDICVCYGCSSVLEFTEDLSVRIADADVIADCDFVVLGDLHKLARKLRKDREMEVSSRHFLEESRGDLSTKEQLCSLIRQSTYAESVLLLILDVQHGARLALQGTNADFAEIPELLERMAQDIRRRFPRSDPKNTPHDGP